MKNSVVKSKPVKIQDLVKIILDLKINELIAIFNLFGITLDFKFKKKNRRKIK